MIIEKNKVVSLTYELETDGQMVEKVNTDKPMTFLFGSGQLLQSFEKNIDGLKNEDEFEFTLKSDEAYGSYSLEMITDIPLNIFKDEQGNVMTNILKQGEYIPLQDDQGRVHNGKVIEIGTETVKMDFNHPLANKDLTFKGKVVEIREATAEEINHGHVHGPGGHQH